MNLQDAVEIAMWVNSTASDIVEPDYKEAIKVLYDDWKIYKYYCPICRTVIKQNENCMCIVDSI